MDKVAKENFYKEDTHKYQINNNQELTTWLEDSEANGYYNPLTIDNLQELIDEITRWYEFKYPERNFENNEYFNNLNLDDNDKISNEMTINQLLYRLSDEKLNLIKCGYRSNMWTGYKESNSEKMKIQSDIIISKKQNEELSFGIPFFVVSADYLTGKILNVKNVKNIIDKEEIFLEELLEVLFNNYQNEYDLTELSNCVYNHKCDVLLRKEILQLVALKLLYSKETTPVRGYERAKHLINDFNLELGANLSTKEIETIIYKNYTESKQDVTKRKLSLTK